ncbi:MULTISPECIES: HdeD family acid-resistance protein [Pseudomonadota]|uniref:HdeD family acid-resistance protein n=1 Tax=Pseudomonadota TaxID=1224 RepID=UPI000AB412F8|nr:MULTISPECIES: DUF308 domain-containing protein [Pseudomonadota]
MVQHGGAVSAANDMAETDELAGPTRLSWQWTVARGVLTLILGVVSLLFPISALFAFTLVFAGYSFIDGILALVTGLTADRKKGGRWWSLILRGVFGIVIGALFVLWPFLMTVSYAVVSTILLAAWAFLGGIAELSAAIRLRKEINGEWLLATSGILLILIGAAIPVLWILQPAATLVSYAWMLGIAFIMIGTLLIVLGFRLRKLTARRSRPRKIPIRTE